MEKSPPTGDWRRDTCFRRLGHLSRQASWHISEWPVPGQLASRCGYSLPTQIVSSPTRLAAKTVKTTTRRRRRRRLLPGYIARANLSLNRLPVVVSRVTRRGRQQELFAARQAKATVKCSWRRQPVELGVAFANCKPSLHNRPQCLGLKWVQSSLLRLLSSKANTEIGDSFGSRQSVRACDHLCCLFAYDRRPTAEIIIRLARVSCRKAR